MLWYFWIRAASSIAVENGSGAMCKTTMLDHLSLSWQYPYKSFSQRQIGLWVQPILKIIGYHLVNNLSRALVQCSSTRPAETFAGGRSKAMHGMVVASLAMPTRRVLPWSSGGIFWNHGGISEAIGAEGALSWDDASPNDRLPDARHSGSPPEHGRPGGIAHGKGPSASLMDGSERWLKAIYNRFVSYHKLVNGCENIS